VGRIYRKSELLLPAYVGKSWTASIYTNGKFQAIFGKR